MIGWAVDLAIVAALVGLVYVIGLIRINGCDTWDPTTQQFGGSCPFAQTREVPRSDGSFDLVYVLGSGRELPADHPTVKTVLFGTRVVDPPDNATYLVGLGYVVLVFVVLQGLTGWTPGKLLAGTRLVRTGGPTGEAGSKPGISAAGLRWVVPDGAIGVLGVIVGLTGGPWIFRVLSADAAVALLNSLACLVAGGLTIGDRVAGTMVVEERLAARRREGPEGHEASERGTDRAAQRPTPPQAETVPSLAGVAGAANGTDWQNSWQAQAKSEESVDTRRQPAGAPGQQELTPHPELAPTATGEPTPATAWLGSTPEATTTPPAWHTASEWTSTDTAEGADSEPWGRREASEQVPAQVGRYDDGNRSPGQGATATDAPQTATDAPEGTGDSPDTGADQTASGGRAAEAAGGDEDVRAADTQNGAASLPDWLEREPIEEPMAEAGEETAPDATSAWEAQPASEQPGPENTAETLIHLPAGTADDDDDQTEAGASGQWEAAPPLWESPSGSQQTDQASEATTAQVEATATPDAASAETAASSADEADERDSLTTGTGTAGTGTAAAGGGASGGSPREPRWDEARQAYIFWDDSRQEWLQFDYESQQWGPITRA